MNQIPPDKDDTHEVRGTFADLVAKVRKRNQFFESRRPLGRSIDSGFAQVTQMTQDEDIQDDNSSVGSQELAPNPSVDSKKTPPSKTDKSSSLVSSKASSSSSSSISFRPVTRSTTSRINSAKWHSKIGSYKEPKRPKKAKTAVNVQVGALVKKRMRVQVGNKSKMAIVFGTVKQKIWNRQWQILFENGRYIKLKADKFEVVSNDSTQKQLNINGKNELSLVTPIEKHIGEFHAEEKANENGLSGKNLEEDIDEEELNE